MNMQIDLMHNGLNRMLNAYKSCRWNELGHENVKRRLCDRAVARDVIYDADSKNEVKLVNECNVSLMFPIHPALTAALYE
jgi:hypothetical protein